MYECFDTGVQGFVDALHRLHRIPRSRSKPTLACYMLAHSFFHGVGVGASGQSHIGKGFSWYIGAVLYNLLRRGNDLWIVRSENCNRDTEGAVRWLRGDDFDVLRSRRAHQALRIGNVTTTIDARFTREPLTQDGSGAPDPSARARRVRELRRGTTAGTQGGVVTRGGPVLIQVVSE